MSLSSFDFQNAPLEELLRAADRSRRERSGDGVELCAIVNAKSGRCPMDCRFCAQSVRYRTEIETYPLLDGRVLVEQTRAMWDRGVRRVGWVTSGCSADPREVDLIVQAAEQCRGGRLCVSLGQLPEQSLTILKQAGVTRYHHNLETSQRFYPSICRSQDWNDRRATVLRAKNLGFELCCGGLFGLGESWQDRFELALALRELEVDSVPLNFLTPIPGTPFAKRSVLSAEEGLRIVAMFRLLLPKATIRICGGRAGTFGRRQSDLFRAGTDAIMTGHYLTTDGISVENDLVLIADNGMRNINALNS